MSWLAEELFRRGMIKVGHFVLTSGIESPYYIDLRKLYSYPELVKKLIEYMDKELNVCRYDGFVGIATSGIALAAFLAYHCNKPMAYVRIERKEHGTRSLVEGDVQGLKVAIVDDVATTGGSIERAFHALKEMGTHPVAAIVVVDREQGAEERIRRLGLEFVKIITASSIFEELYRKELIDDETYKKIMEYIASHRPKSL